MPELTTERIVTPRSPDKALDWLMTTGLAVVARVARLAAVMKPLVGVAPAVAAP